MIIQNVFNTHEAYTHPNWVYKNITVGFSRLYYVIDGEAYYEESGKRVELKKGYLYLTPVNVRHTLYDNPNNRLLHTFSHIVTVPTISELIEVKVEEGSILSDAVTLWRKHIKSKRSEELIPIIQLILSYLEKNDGQISNLAQKTKNYIDSLNSFSFSMQKLSYGVGYTREHITRSFIAAYGITPKKYYNQKRMKSALELLASGAKLNAISASLSFSSAYAFSKAFKSHFGISPQKYRSTFLK